MSDPKVGIVGYGVSIPYYRIKTKDIADAWERDIDPEKSLLVKEKSVPDFDEDTITLSVDASLNALKRARINASDINALFVGSESHPYAVKPSSVAVADALGVSALSFSADTEFACKAGTAAMQIVIAMVKSGLINFGLAVGADTSQGAPGDALEYTAGAGAGAFIFGIKNAVAEVVDTLSFATDTPDFWRRPKETYPKHGGRFTGEPAYFKHIEGATIAFLERTKTKPEDYDYVIFHMPNGKFPRIIAKRLGFTFQQLEPSLTVDYIGNPYSAASPVGLTRVLDLARPNQAVLMTSYGSGSGADSFSFLTTKRLAEVQKLARTTDEYIEHKKYVSYVKYAKMRGKIK
jgi:hydroxymethylglutaryl-CoA synthase